MIIAGTIKRFKLSSGSNRYLQSGQIKKEIIKE